MDAKSKIKDPPGILLEAKKYGKTMGKMVFKS